MSICEFVISIYRLLYIKLLYRRLKTAIFDATLYNSFECSIVLYVIICGDSYALFNVDNLPIIGNLIAGFRLVFISDIITGNFGVYGRNEV